MNEPIFEIEEEGFDDGEIVTIGITQPPNCLLSFTGENKVIHLVSLDGDGRNASSVLMDLLENGLDNRYLANQKIEIVVEER
jgi:hypothetical protein